MIPFDLGFGGVAVVASYRNGLAFAVKDHPGYCAMHIRRSSNVCSEADSSHYSSVGSGIPEIAETSTGDAVVNTTTPMTQGEG